MLDRFHRNYEKPQYSGDVNANGENPTEGSHRTKLSKHKHENILGNRIETLPSATAVSLQAPLNARAGISIHTSVHRPTNDDRDTLDDYRAAQAVCPSASISIIADTARYAKVNSEQSAILDAGKCILCGRCQEISPNLFKLNNVVSPATKKRKDLIQITPFASTPPETKIANEDLGKQLRDRISKIFGRSLAIRQVDAGSCNGCEVEITALSNPIYDIERFGIHFVASPRHADALLVTGPASRNMEVALKRTYDATPSPKIVIAVGACACSGGIFGDTYATTGGIEDVVPVDVFIPGCPPRPEALLYGLLSALDRITIGKSKQSNATL